VEFKLKPDKVEAFDSANLLSKTLSETFRVNTMLSISAKKSFKDFLTLDFTE